MSTERIFGLHILQVVMTSLFVTYTNSSEPIDTLKIFRKDGSVRLNRDLFMSSLRLHNKRYKVSLFDKPIKYLYHYWTALFELKWTKEMFYDAFMQTSIEMIQSLNVPFDVDEDLVMVWDLDKNVEVQNYKSKRASDRWELRYKIDITGNTKALQKWETWE